MIHNSTQNQEILKPNIQSIHTDRMNDQELQKFLQQKVQLEELWASDQIKIKNLTNELNRLIALNESFQKKYDILLAEKNEYYILSEYKLQEQAKHYLNKLEELKREKNEVEEVNRRIKIELDLKNNNLYDKDIQQNILKLEFEDLNNIYQTLLNEYEVLKNQLTQSGMQIQKLVELQKSMNYSLNFLTKKDESNNKIIENFKETEKFFLDKIQQQRKNETEYKIKISELKYQIKLQEDQEGKLHEQLQIFKDEVKQNQSQINLQQLKIRELNDEIQRLRMFFQEQSMIDKQNKSEQYLQILTQEIKYTYIEQSEYNKFPQEATRQTIEQQNKYNCDLISGQDKQILELEERILYQEAQINKLKEQSQIQINKKQQKQYSKFNPFKVFFSAAAKSKLDVSKIQVKQ